MTISSTVSRNDYIGSGITGPYSYSFRIVAATDLVVTQRDMLGNEHTLQYLDDYTVTGVNSPNGGTITLETALPSGYGLTLRREVELVQETDLRNQGVFFPEVHEDVFDRLVMMAQQQKDAIDRAFRFGPTVNAGSVSPLLPTPDGDAALVWNSAGTALTNRFLDSSVDIALPGDGRTVASLTGYLDNNKIFNVKDYHAVGNDSTDNTAAFAATFAAVLALGGTRNEIWFPAGIYRISAAQNWFLTGLTLRAIGQVTIKSTATSGNIVEFDAGALANGYRAKMLGDFVLDSTNAGVQVGLYTRNVHHSEFQCRVRNVTTAACKIDGAVITEYAITCTEAGGAMTTIPVNGIVVNSSATVSATTACAFKLLIEAATGDGVVLNDASANTFRGTSEGVGGRGLVIAAGCISNRFDAFFLEENALGDIDCDGNGNRFVGCTASSRAAGSPFESVKSIIFGAGSERNSWEGGFFYAASVEATALANCFWMFDSSFSVIDAGTDTMVWGRQTNLSAAILKPVLPLLNAFTNLTLINSWAGVSGAFFTPAYTKCLSTGEVILRGAVGGGSAGSVIAVLPAGSRPAKKAFFNAPATNAKDYAVVSVDTSGNVTQEVGYTTAIDLSAVRFFV